ncbi:hypothetical protein K2173_017133 [Erythroxylum novogranatense]|uniref:Uncharacterized protein n=1 Tax=Erythroxylum novogranatense TaxID=1862640 RepID=A0AAV8U5T9_9ROSI|nr:hypothetical protein K2173_017133 [Erythroxylum novogranatense]
MRSMKLDSEQIFSHGTIGHKPECKPAECNENGLESRKIEPQDGILKENLAGIFCNFTDRQGDTDQLPYFSDDEDGRRDSKLNISVREDNLTDDNKKFIKDFVAPITSTHPSSELPSFGKDLRLHTDRRSIEHGLPELMVCYEENTYHIIKDICIDEGVPSRDKFLFDADFDEKNVCALLPPGNDINDGMTKESHGIEMSLPDLVKCSAEKENTDLHLPVAGVLRVSEKEGFTNQISPELEPDNLKVCEEATNDATEKLKNATFEESLKDLLATALFGEDSVSESSNSSTVEIEEKESVQMARENVLLAPTSAHESENGRERTVATPVISAAEDTGSSQEAFLTAPPFDITSDKSNLSQEKPVLDPALRSTTDLSIKYCDDAKLESNALNYVPEESTSRAVNELPYNSHSRIGSMTYDFGSSPHRASSDNGCLQNVDCDHPEIGNSSRLEYSNATPVSSRFQYSPGESSFSSAVPPSGLITYSGPIVAAGNLSVRSDSSATSTRSFAFPVLQTEWNSSPVRMAKGNQRQLQKHRRWRESILCCKF